jgi:hypothetical protein
MTTQRESTTTDDQLWLHEHMEELPQYNGQWVAVLERKIVAWGATAGDVVDQLEEHRINGALLVQFPDDVHRKLYFIG